MALRNKLYIYVILDGSGSMSSVQDDVVGGINALIQEQKELDADDTFFSLTTFDTNVKQWYDETPMKEVDDVDRSITFMGGGTALLDAVGKTLQDARDKKLEGRKLVVIYTDGYENQSREWDNKGVKTLIDELEGEGDWAFTFMSADVDNFGQAQAMGIAAGNYMTTNSATTYGATRTVSSAASFYRSAPVAMAAPGGQAATDFFTTAGINEDTIAELDKEKDSDTEE